MSIELTSLDNLTAEAVQAKQDVLTEILQDAYPEVDISRGALHDIVLYLHAILATKTSMELDRYKASRSLLDVSNDPTLADEDCVNRILSNFNISRKSATYTTGFLTLEYERDLSTLIPSNTKFTFGSDVYVTTEGIIAYATDSQLSNKLVELENGRYGITIPVTASTAGAMTPINQGDLVETELEDAVSVYAASDFTLGRDEESNLSLVSRLAEGLAVPCWGNRYHVNALIRQNVSTVTDVSVVGIGDEEMLRDRLTIFPVSVGGKADIYVKTRVETRIHTCSATYIARNGVNGVWQTSIPASVFPGCYRAVVARQNGNEYEITNETILNDEGTANQVRVIEFERDELILKDLGTSEDFEIVLIGQSDIQSITDIFENPEFMPITEDAMVISARPAWVTTTVTLSSRADNEEAISAAITDKINATGFCTKLPASELIRVILPCLTTDQQILGLTMTAEVWGFNNSVYRSASMQTLEVPNDSLNRVSAKTTVFYTDEVVFRYD